MNFSIININICFIFAAFLFQFCLVSINPSLTVLLNELNKLKLWFFKLTKIQSVMFSKYNVLGSSEFTLFIIKKRYLFFLNEYKSKAKLYSNHTSFLNYLGLLKIKLVIICNWLYYKYPLYSSLFLSFYLNLFMLISLENCGLETYAFILLSVFLFTYVCLLCTNDKYKEKHPMLYNILIIVCGTILVICLIFLVKFLLGKILENIVWVKIKYVKPAENNNDSNNNNNNNNGPNKPDNNNKAGPSKKRVNKTEEEEQEEDRKKREERAKLTKKQREVRANRTEEEKREDNRKRRQDYANRTEEQIQNDKTRLNKKIKK